MRAGENSVRGGFLKNSGLRAHKVVAEQISLNYTNTLFYECGSLLKEVFMAVPGYIDYTRREYCKDIQCPVQMKLEESREGSAEYEQIRSSCKTECCKTTYEFHHWLIDRGYQIVRPE